MPDQPHCRTLRVLGLEKLGRADCFHLVLEDPAWAWTPGQFLMLRPDSWGLDPFGPRPFSIADTDAQGLHLYIQAVGRGTRRLAELEPGEPVPVWGPLGQGFVYDQERPLLLLAGGMGLAPFVGLIRSHLDPVRLELLFGHRQALECYPFAELEKMTLAWHFQDTCPEDLQLLRQAVQEKIRNYAEDGLVLACGPLPFLRMIKTLGADCRAEVQISLETAMMCGIGACLGCAVPAEAGGNLQTCVQGPVFRADEVRLGNI